MSQLGSFENHACSRALEGLTAEARNAQTTH